MCGMGATVAGRTLDPESAEWIRRLSASGRDCDRARSDLHAMLLRFARSQTNRRAGRFHVTGPEVDDVAHQAAADAMIAITGKLDDFRGDSRFTTWAFKFVLLEVSSKLGRHFWRDAGPHYDADDWDRLPDVFGLDPAQESEWRDLIAGLAARDQHHAHRPAAPTVRLDRAQAGATRCPGREAGIEPQRNLQKLVRCPA